MIFPSELRGYRNRTHAFKMKMRERRLESDVNLHGALKREGVKQGLSVSCVY